MGLGTLRCVREVRCCRGASDWLSAVECSGFRLEGTRSLNSLHLNPLKALTNPRSPQRIPEALNSNSISKLWNTPEP